MTDRSAVGSVVRWVLIAALVLLFLFPLYWMICIGMKGREEVLLIPPTLFPTKVVWNNFVKATTEIPFWRWSGNSLYLATMVTVGTVISTPMVAYGLAWIPFKGRDIVFGSTIAATLIPFTATMIPLYLIFAKLHLINTFWPLIIPSFLGNAGLIFMLRQFFRGVPPSMVEAATVDGANHWQIYRYIMWPLARPAISVAAVWAFIGSWNDFFGPLLYMQDESMFTIQLGLTQYRTLQTNHTEWQMAGATLTILPVVFVVLLVQRGILRQELRAGVKG
ncbi:MAG TPA: carbohydrate ABC transporter permease [Symbiobacteriaceae bacterium]|nr:carbohydrate ABC transporter permease [Symbiobacteriaceae bacterium]